MTAFKVKFQLHSTNSIVNFNQRFIQRLITFTFECFSLKKKFETIIVKEVFSNENDPTRSRRRGNVVLTFPPVFIRFVSFCSAADSRGTGRPIQRKEARESCPFFLSESKSKVDFSPFSLLNFPSARCFTAQHLRAIFVFDSIN